MANADLSETEKADMNQFRAMVKRSPKPLLGALDLLGLGTKLRAFAGKKARGSRITEDRREAVATKGLQASLSKTTTMVGKEVRRALRDEERQHTIMQVPLGLHGSHARLCPFLYPWLNSLSVGI